MKLSSKMVLAAWLLTISLLSSAEAGSLGNLRGKSSSSKSTNSFSNKNFSPKNLSSNKVGNFTKNKPTQNFSPKVFSGNTTKFAPTQTRNLNTIGNKNLNVIKNPIQNMKPERTHSPVLGGKVKLPGVIAQPRAPFPGGGLPINPGAGGKTPPLNPLPGGKIPPINPFPGGKIPPINPFPGGKIPPINPNPGGGKPPIDPGTGGGTPPINPNPPYCPPHCPPHYCPPGWWPRPICLPPIRLCPPVCYNTCVTTVCPNVIVDQTVVVEQPVVEEAVEPMLQLLVGKPATLEAEGLGDVAGSVAIEVGGIGLPTQVRSWTDKMLVIDVPFVGLNGPTPAMLHLFDANGKPLASIPVELVVPVAELPAEAAE